MRGLVQRVTRASVTVAERPVGAIGPGLLLLVGVTASDDPDDIGWLVRKIVNLRVFSDDAGVMNRSVAETGGAILAVSQFTLFASTRKGNRPSWAAAAPPEAAKPLFDQLVAELAAALGKPVATGVFGADMAVALVNDGPVTILLDSQLRE